ncbi:MAG: PadR family transcriptional regulator [Candidatus Bathyarchaeota archaeon]|nr:PadR family transcriptional regulator [Candidatus Bathyarchaeum tardum]WGM89422.1 MAG: PadR family transcriptional regulator [Candidatus Bathyarchaeum tardum]WNZ28299.1 MAG: PadR family transcriptional regulator [Candidatus Bathyarchaeota archaeon]
MPSKIVEKLRRRTIKTFMDMLILGELQEKPLSGYDIIGLIHKRFNVLVSSGTVYSLLYSLERDGLVAADLDSRKRVYTLTDKGKKTLETVGRAHGEINGLVQNLIAGNKSA